MIKALRKLKWFYKNIVLIDKNNYYNTKTIIKIYKTYRNLKFCIDIKKSQVYNADKDKGVTQISVMPIFVISNIYMWIGICNYKYCVLSHWQRGHETGSWPLFYMFV